MAERSEDRLARDRQHMVQTQLVARGITNPRVLEAMLSVPREVFVPSHLVESAYDDKPLPIGSEQTISQPFIVALMLQALQLEGHEKALDVGTGSGYAAALLARLAREVYSVERIGHLAEEAAQRLQQLGYRVPIKHGDGTLGWAEHAPYDAIAVAASAPSVPQALLDQLAPGGRMVIPVRQNETQLLTRIVRGADNRFETEIVEEVRFVPLIGAQGEPSA